MGPDKNTVNFNNYWPFLTREAERRGLSKGAWFRRSGVDLQRYSEFDKGKRCLSAFYFVKIVGGLLMTPEQMPALSGIDFTDEQTRELDYYNRCESERVLLERLLSDPKKIEILKKEYDIK